MKAQKSFAISKASESGQRLVEKWSDNRLLTPAALINDKIAEVQLDPNFPSHLVWIGFGAYAYPAATVNPRWHASGELNFYLNGQSTFTLPLLNVDATGGDNGATTIPRFAMMPTGSAAPALRALGVDALGDDGFLDVPCWPLNIKADKAVLSLRSVGASYANASWLFGMRVLSRN